MAIESYKLRSRVISGDRDLYVAIDNNSKTKKESYIHLLSRQSKIFGVPMKNIEMSLTGHRRYITTDLTYSHTDWFKQHLSVYFAMVKTYVFISEFVCTMRDV